MKNQEHIFSIEEANAILPDLDAAVGRLMEKKRVHTQRHDELLMHELLCQAETRGGIAVENGDLEKSIHALEAAIEEIEDDIRHVRKLGAAIRDLDEGHVHLPGKLDGEPIYFCWKHGEKHIRFYHRHNSHAAERFELV